MRQPVEGSSDDVQASGSIAIDRLTSAAGKPSVVHHVLAILARLPRPSTRIYISSFKHLSEHCLGTGLRNLLVMQNFRRP